MEDNSSIQFGEDIQDILRIKGILSKGYGILPKYPMLDRDLHVESKGIYAYFCSLSGNGNTTFPSLTSILGHLNINKDTYYKYFRELQQNGYITAHQETVNGVFSRNIITIESNPKKLMDIDTTKSDSQMISKIKMQGLKASGFGVIPRAVMFDTRLSLRSKSIYAYFSSFLGSGDSIYPKRETILYHLGIGKDAFYSNYNNLITLNYISIVQRRTNGKMGVNDYYINDFPDESKLSEKKTKTPCPDFSETGTSESDKSDTGTSESGIPDTDISETNINNRTKNKLFKNNKEIIFLSHSQCHSHSKTDDISKKDHDRTSGTLSKLRAKKLGQNESKVTVSTEKFLAMQEFVKEQINYDWLVERYQSEDTDLQKYIDVDAMVHIICETLLNSESTIRINGINLPASVVRSVFYKLTCGSIVYVHNKFSQQSHYIKYKKAYMLTCLYNAVLEGAMNGVNILGINNPKPK